jgi:hypothetical protein
VAIERVLSFFSSVLGSGFSSLWEFASEVVLFAPLIVNALFKELIIEFLALGC